MFELIRNLKFDSKKSTVYFNYSGNEELNVYIELLYQGEILHRTNMELHDNPELSYYISYYNDNYSNIPYIDIVVHFSNSVKSYKIKDFNSLKKVVLVSTYCDTQEKKDIFFELVKKVKRLGLDVIAISPIPLETQLIESCDYFFYTKDNPILVWPERKFTFWHEIQLSDNRILTLHRNVIDYGWAALLHVKKLSQIALNYDYDIFYHMIYDLDIDENVEEALINFKQNTVFHRKDPNDPDTIWETTLHLMVFDREMMEKIEKEIVLENYLFSNGVAEGQVLNWKKKFDIKGSEFSVRDKIFYWKDYDFFDYSPIKDFKLFMSKNDEMDILVGNPECSVKLPPTFRMLFYNFKENLNLNVFINDKIFEINLKDSEYIEFPFNSLEINSLILEYDRIKYDLTEDYKKITMNQIYYNIRF